MSRSDFFYAVISLNVSQRESDLCICAEREHICTMIYFYTEPCRFIFYFCKYFSYNLYMEHYVVRSVIVFPSSLADYVDSMFRGGSRGRTIARPCQYRVWRHNESLDPPLCIKLEFVLFHIRLSSRVYCNSCTNSIIFSNQSRTMLITSATHRSEY